MLVLLHKSIMWLLSSCFKYNAKNRISNKSYLQTSGINVNIFFRSAIVTKSKALTGSQFLISDIDNEVNFEANSSCLIRLPSL